MNKELEKKTKEDLSRRKVLKKAVYVAPIVIGLGALVSPSESNAFGNGDGNEKSFSCCSINLDEYKNSHDC